MWPYYLLIIIPPLILLIIDSVSKQKKTSIHLSTSAFFIIWLFLLMFRDESVGVDIGSYHSLFDNYSTSSVKSVIYEFGIEKGYSLWNILFHKVSHDYQLFLAVTAIFCIVPVWLFYYKRTENVLFTILLFLTVAPFTMYFSGLRQSMAMAFVFPAFVFARDKKIIPFMLMVLLAFTFHQSALIMGVMYPIYHLRLKKYGAFLMTLFAVIVFVGARFFFSMALPFFGERYEERYGTIDGNGAVGMFILFLIFFIYCSFVLDFEKLSDEYNGIRNILAFVVILQALANVNNMVMRMNYYFLPLLPLLFEKTAISPRIQYKEVSKMATLIIIVSFAYRFVMVVYSGTEYDTDILQVYPWVPFWN